MIITKRTEKFVRESHNALLRRDIMLKKQEIEEKKREIKELKRDIRKIKRRER
jgi:cell division protein FtsL